MDLKKIATVAAKTAAQETYKAILKIAQDQPSDSYAAVKEIKEVLAANQIEATVTAEPIQPGVPLAGEKIVITFNNVTKDGIKIIKIQNNLRSIGKKYNVQIVVEGVVLK
jgi:phosphoglucomutase